MRSKVATFFVVLVITGALLIVASKIDPVAPTAPACKVCHCGKTLCHRECGAENMCVLKCEGLCNRAR